MAELVVWLCGWGVWSGVWSWEVEERKGATWGRRAWETEGEFGGRRDPGKGSFFLGKGSWRAEVESVGVVEWLLEKPRRGRDRSEEFGLHPPRQRTRVVFVEFGCWRRRGFFWGVGESREAEQTHNRVWGVEKEDQERPLHFFLWGRAGAGRTVLVWERVGGEV